MNNSGQFKRKYNIKNEQCFSNINRTSAWLLGMLASDGCVKKNVITISQSNDIGKSRIEFIKSIYDCDYPIYTSIPNKGGAVYTLTITSKCMVEQLAEYNIVPNKTLSFDLSDNILDVNLQSFIQGYIEGDGTIGVYKKNTGYELLTVILVGTLEFLNSLNDRVPVKGNVRHIKHSKIYESRWTGKKAIQLIDWVYSDNVFEESPKYNKYISYRESHTPKYLKYDVICNEAQELLNDGHSIMNVSKILDVHFQLLYKWKTNGRLVVDK